MSRPHRSFSANDKGRDFVCGDLHGMFDALTVAMHRVGFDTERDRMFSVGDIVDRGPDSARCLELVNEPWFHAVRGNHEELMIDVWHGKDPLNWWLNGGRWAYELPAEHMSRLARMAARLPYALTVELADGGRVGVCHAEPAVDDWAEIETACGEEETRTQMVWGRSWLRGDGARTVANVDLTVHGHTPVDEPTRLANALFIDTGCVYGGELTVIELAGEIGRARPASGTH
ncbi:MAG: metallophosphoesterase [Sphingomonadales bacterium]|nr:metallophosphoesterase [Sphingomonadales bacterium]